LELYIVLVGFRDSFGWVLKEFWRGLDRLPARLDNSFRWARSRLFPLGYRSCFGLKNSLFLSIGRFSVGSTLIEFNQILI